MTNKLNSTSPHILTIDNTFHLHAGDIHTPGHIDGEIRYYNGEMFVWHDRNWSPVLSEHQIMLDYNSEMALDWAVKKMQEEKELDDLCERFPSLEKARDQFEMIKALVASEIEKE